MSATEQDTSERNVGSYQPAVPRRRLVSPGGRRWIQVLGKPSGDRPSGSQAGPANAGIHPDPETSKLARRQQGFWRVLFVSIWLGQLIPTLQRAWNAPEVGWRIVGVVAVIGFCAFYVGIFVFIRQIRVGFHLDPPWQRSWGLLGVGFALILAAVPAAGETVLVMSIYLGILIMFLMPARVAIVLVSLDATAVALLSKFVPGWTDSLNLAFQVLIAALAIWGVIQMMQRNNQLAQAREEITSLAVSQERMRFSRDMHDILGHTLTVITLKAELAGRLVQLDPARAEHEIAEVERLARTALVDVRATVAGYRDVSLAVELASARMALDAAGIEADLAGTVDDVPADRLELFGWAVREGVTNVVRHSGARRCRVSVDCRAVEIADDGRGPGQCERSEPLIGQPAVEPPAVGHGLAGLRERAQAAGARLSIGQSEDGGFLLRVGWGITR